MKQDKSITKQKVDGRDMLVSSKSCAYLQNMLGDLQFMLQSTQITIKPKGYLYSLPNQDDCFIGVQSIPDKFNQFRLGTIFLRNFYTGLDFDKNLILIGLN
jgi:lipopolysaccharide assembly outer membrane protein LptD (OstA)